jgi:hypothetical protein
VDSGELLCCCLFQFFSASVIEGCCSVVGTLLGSHLWGYCWAGDCTLGELDLLDQGASACRLRCQCHEGTHWPSMACQQ